MWSHLWMVATSHCDPIIKISQPFQQIFTIFFLLRIFKKKTCGLISHTYIYYTKRRTMAKLVYNWVISFYCDDIFG